MLVFLLWQEGVSSNDVAGVYSSRDLAESARQAAMVIDKKPATDFWIETIELDATPYSISVEQVKEA